jgi:hypothetical protein
MINFLSVLGAPAAERIREAESREGICSRLHRLDASLQQGSPTHDAALVLLAGAVIGHNIDRLARFAGLQRELVARSVRRLVDNGVWQDGNAVCRWLDDPAADPDGFWADVAVAEGKLCRRMDERGEMEWAPQGYWRKHYEYVGPKSDEQPQVVCYHPHVASIAQDLPYLPDQDEDDDSLDPTAFPVREGPRDESTPEGTTLWLGGEDTAVAEEPWSSEAEPPAGDLFPGTVWLG